jgi:protocatechuate 3,4-dioxygenase beta subunit
VALSDAQRTGTVTASLIPATGSIRGSATIDGVAERGLTVTISGGDVDRTKPIVSQGPSAGGFVFEALPAPATYTLTFGGADVLPQVQVIDLDPRAGRVSVDGVDVSLSRTTTAVRGIVRDSEGEPVRRATVSLTDGANTFEFFTADEPAGEFEFGTVPPGSYTLSASRVGTEPAVVIVTVNASQAPPFVNLTLSAQASLSGRVVDGDGNPTSVERTVRLFDPNRFPNAGALITTVTDAQGNYVFDGLEAPTSFVVAVYESDTSADPVDSVVIRTVPSVGLDVPDLLGETPTAPVVTVAIAVEEEPPVEEEIPVGDEVPA